MSTDSQGGPEQPADPNSNLPRRSFISKLGGWLFERPRQEVSSVSITNFTMHNEALAIHADVERTRINNDRVVDVMDPGVVVNRREEIGTIKIISIPEQFMIMGTKQDSVRHVVQRIVEAKGAKDAVNSLVVQIKAGEHEDEFFHGEYTQGLLYELLNARHGKMVLPEGTVLTTLSPGKIESGAELDIPDGVEDLSAYFERDRTGYGEARTEIANILRIDEEHLQAR